MAENITIARPYAKAVFAQGLQDRTLDEWETLLQALTSIAADPQVSPLLESPLISGQQWLTLFTQAAEKIHPNIVSRLQKELNNFLRILINEKRLRVLPDILSRYQSLMADERGIKKVQVTSAFALDENRRKHLTESLTRYLHSKVTVDFREDPHLIGGAVIRSGHWVMDGSIKGKLQTLRDNLQE